MNSRCDQAVTQDSGNAQAFAIWTFPMEFARVIHDMQVDYVQAWARACWRNGHRREHEPPDQLEVPEPIAHEFEQDLFA